MSRTFINGLSCISCQPTFTSTFPFSFLEKQGDNILIALEPDYKPFISPAANRRMAKGVKMGVATATEALKQAQIAMPEAILVGTGMGCLQDSEKFLKGILDNQEQYLTPTAFIQSTHNTVAGQIALNMQCKGMNFTYVNGNFSFESALLEAKMQMEQSLLKEILIGGVEEQAPHTLYLYELAGILKKKEELSEDLLSSETSGICLGEGASFFALSDKKNENSFAEVINISLCNQLEPDEIAEFVKNFLSREGITLSDIEMVISGRNGNIADTPYFSHFEHLFPSVPILCYKHLCGEFFTASSFGLWAACHILKTGIIPPEMKLYPEKEGKQNPTSYLLLYNQSLGKEHSLILLKKAL